MTKNTQEYINGLINKSRMWHLDLSSPCSVSNCSRCNKKTYSENSPNLSGEIEDLKEFSNLASLNASNSKFTNLNALLTIPNKDKVKGLNFFGNKIREVDLAWIFNEFPNLQKLNLDRNPLSAKNLNNLTEEQLTKLAEGLKSKQIRISLSQGTVMADLLEYTQQLIKQGGSSSAQRLEAVLQNSSVKSEAKPNKTNYVPFILGGVLVVSLALVVGYLVGKRKVNKNLPDF